MSSTVNLQREELSKPKSEIVNGVFSRLRFNLLRASRFEEKHYVMDAIKQIAIRVLFILQAVFLAAVLPWPFKGAAIIMTSLGAPFLAGFFFLREPFYPSEWAESSSPTSLNLSQ